MSTSVYTTANVVGTDGVIPIQNPEACWKTYAMREIFFGKEGKGRYVPNVGDWVVDTITKEFFEVLAISDMLIPTLVKINTNTPGTDLDPVDVLMGVGVGAQSETFRLYVNKRTRPYSLAVDHRFTVKGSNASHALIFRGTNISQDGEVISGYFDQTGQMTAQKIPLELVRDPDGTNRTERTVMDCFTTTDLKDNEKVWVVAYSDVGIVIQKQQLLVENTAFIRTPDQGKKYISDIYLESPFLSTSDPNLVEYPVNVPVRGFNMMGVVKYNDNSTIRLPVDGRKFSMDGLSDYVATVPGLDMPALLRYNLSADEVGVGLKISGDGYFKNKRYTFRTMRADGTYTVMLYAYPVWIDVINGYRLEWFMANLDRSKIYRVTPYVRLNDNGPAFNPIGYGVAQRLSVSINLSEVNPLYKNYVHTQVLDVVLVRPGSDALGTRWTMSFELGQQPPYGRENFAQTSFINSNLTKIKIDQGEKTLDAWLERMFYLTKPLFDQGTEIRAPKPERFNLIIGDQKVEYTIENWNQELIFNGLVPDFSTIYLEFFTRVPSNDIILGISGLPVFRVS